MKKEWFHLVQVIFHRLQFVVKDGSVSRGWAWVGGWGWGGGPQGWGGGPQAKMSKMSVGLKCKKNVHIFP